MTVLWASLYMYHNCNDWIAPLTLLFSDWNVSDVEKKLFYLERELPSGHVVKRQMNSNDSIMGYALRAPLLVLGSKKLTCTSQTWLQTFSLMPTTRGFSFSVWVARSLYTSMVREGTKKCDAYTFTYVCVLRV